MILKNRPSHNHSIAHYVNPCRFVGILLAFLFNWGKTRDKPRKWTLVVWREDRVTCSKSLIYKLCLSDIFLFCKRCVFNPILPKQRHPLSLPSLRCSDIIRWWMPYSCISSTGQFKANRSLGSPEVLTAKTRVHICNPISWHKAWEMPIDVAIEVS